MYRTIESSIWNDKKFLALPAPGKLLFLYLITNPHTHVAGIYHLPPIYLLHETTLKPESLDRVWDTLSKHGMAKRDTDEDLVWVCNMFRYQGRGVKNDQAAARQIKNLPKSPLIQEFLVKYPEVTRWTADRVSDTVSDPEKYSRGPYPLEQSRAEQNRADQTRLRAAHACGEPADANSPPPVVPLPAGGSVVDSGNAAAEAGAGPTAAVVTAAAADYPTFACVAGRKSTDRTWLLTDAQIGNWSATFPGVDVPAECRKAHAWVDASPARRKTASGMAVFLFQWLSRSQNQGGGRPAGSGPGPPMPPRQDRDERRMAELERARAERRAM